VARIRTIKPEFFTSTQVVECSPTARLLFVGVWVFSDDGGVHPDDPIRLKMEVFPGDSFSREIVADLVEELVGAGLLRRFTSEGTSYLEVTGWRHQKIDKPTFRFPRPPVTEASSNSRRGVYEGSPPEGSLRESSLKEDTPYSPPSGILRKDHLSEKHQKAFGVLTKWFTYLSREHLDKLPMDQGLAANSLCTMFETCDALTRAIDLAIGNNWRSLKPEHGLGSEPAPYKEIPYPEH